MNNKGNNESLITRITVLAQNIANGFLLPKAAYNELFVPFVNNSSHFFYIDGWTITHLFCGIFFGYLYLFFKWDPGKFIIIMILICFIWEIFEYICGITLLKIRGPDSLTDAIVDTLFFMLGATVAYKNIRTIK